MRFQVPQFIEIEDKIFGPFTFKQFIYLSGGTGLCFIAYTILPFFVAIIIMIPVAALSVALAFYKVNNKSFIEITEYFLKYSMDNKLYIWKKEKKQINKEVIKKTEDNKVKIPTLSDGKIKDLSFNLDIKQKVRERN